MSQTLHKLVDRASEYFAARKGLLPLLGLALVLINYMLLIFAPQLFIAQSNLCLHLGIVLIALGQLLALAL